MKRTLLIVFFIVLPAMAHGDGLLNDMTPSAYSIPPGWELLVTQDFEGSCPASQYCGTQYGGLGMTTTKPHTGSKSLEGIYDADQDSTHWLLREGNVGDYTELYISFWEWTDADAQFNDEYFLARIAVDSPYFEEIVIESAYWCNPFNQTSCGLYYTCQHVSPYDDCGAVRLTTHDPAEGAWIQWEIHIRPNQDGSLSDGFLRIYKNGQLWGSRENVLLNGLNDMHSSGGPQVQVGGVYTKLVWMTDYPTCSIPSGCSPAPGTGNDLCVSYKNWWGQPFSSPLCSPIDPPLSSFHRYFDDIIVMKASNPPPPVETQPYPTSTDITGVTWDHSGAIQAATGSDIWATTWTNDNRILTSWGDGGGFYAPDDTYCRARLGISEIFGTPPSLTYNNLIGCATTGVGCIDPPYTHLAACDPDYPNTMGSGYPDDIIDINGTLYLMSTAWSAYPAGTQTMFKSTNGGQTWTALSWSWDPVLEWYASGFIQYDAGYSNGPSYLYVYGAKAANTTNVYLARVPIGSVETKSSYQWFTGTSSSPSWGDIGSATAVIVDPTRTSLYWGPYFGPYVSAAYFPVIGKYLVAFPHEYSSQMGLLESDNPYGPWYTVDWDMSWGNYPDGSPLSYNFAQKWRSSDDKTFYIAWSSNGVYDSFNLVKGTLTLAGPSALQFDTGATLPTGNLGSSYSTTLSASGGTPSYSFMYQRDDNSPYPASTYITGSNWDFANEVNTGYGSDMWASTWAADGYLWTAWGDGGGPNTPSDDTVCRTRQGVGFWTHTPPSSPSFVDVSGCKADGTGCIDNPTHDPACNAPYASGNYGWTNAILYVNGYLFQLSGRQYPIYGADPYPMDYYYSTNGGQTWSLGLTFPATIGSFRPQTWIQYGQNYAGGGSYIYTLGVENQSYPHNGHGYNLYLARTPVSPITSLLNASAYEYFTGTPSSPSWGTWANRKPILTDASIIGWESMSYNPGLGRYILSGRQGAPTVCVLDNPARECWTTMNNLHVYEAANPWGPFYTVEYTSSWHGFDGSEGGGTAWGLQVLFPTKWMSGDGKTMYGVWSGGNVWDRYYQVKYTVTTSPTNAEVPPGLSVNSNGTITGTPTQEGNYTFTARVTDSAGTKVTRVFTLPISSVQTMQAPNFFFMVPMP